MLMPYRALCGKTRAFQEKSSKRGLKVEISRQILQKYTESFQEKSSKRGLKVFPARNQYVVIRDPFQEKSSKRGLKVCSFNALFLNPF